MYVRVERHILNRSVIGQSHRDVITWLQPPAVAGLNSGNCWCLMLDAGEVRVGHEGYWLSCNSRIMLELSVFSYVVLPAGGKEEIFHSIPGEGFEKPISSVFPYVSAKLMFLWSWNFLTFSTHSLRKLWQKQITRSGQVTRKKWYHPTSDEPLCFMLCLSHPFFWNPTQWFERLGGINNTLHSPLPGRPRYEATSVVRGLRLRSLCRGIVSCSLESFIVAF